METNRCTFLLTYSDEQAIREIYLKPFETCVKNFTGGALAVMSSFNWIGTRYSGSNSYLLNNVLRSEWGYQGMVMTDWWAKMNDEGQPGTKENTAAMVRAQNDVYMVVSDSASNSGKDNTMQALKKGAITRAQLVRNAANICRFLMRSPVMNRFLDREFDCCEVKNDFAAQNDFAGILDRVRVDGCADLAVDALGTRKGTSACYVLTFADSGKYRLSFRMKSDMQLQQTGLTAPASFHKTASYMAGQKTRQTVSLTPEYLSRTGLSER